MTYLLVVVSSTLIINMVPFPLKRTVSEFSSKEACEAALEEAKKEWYTIDNKSFCISVEEYKNKQEKISELRKLQKELNQ